MYKIIKACLVLANHLEQYQAEEKVDVFLYVLQDYNISYSFIGAFISDNHDNNNKMICIFKKFISDLSSVKHICICYLGHVM